MLHNLCFIFHRMSFLSFFCSNDTFFINSALKFEYPTQQDKKKHFTVLAMEALNHCTLDLVILVQLICVHESLCLCHALTKWALIGKAEQGNWHRSSAEYNMDVVMITNGAYTVHLHSCLFHFISLHATPCSVWLHFVENRILIKVST